MNDSSSKPNDPGPKAHGTDSRVPSLPIFGPPIAAFGPPIATRGHFPAAPEPSFAGTSSRPAFPGLQNSQSGNQQQASKEQYPLQFARRTNVNQDLLQEHLSTLSVGEKVRKGIAMGFANTLPYKNTPPGIKLPMDCMTVGDMMKRVDTAYHMSPALSSFHFEGAPNGADMINKELPFNGYAPVARLAAHQNRMQHMQSIIPQL
jgi:hypothetical protein